MGQFVADYSALQAAEVLLVATASPTSWASLSGRLDLISDLSRTPTADRVRQLCGWADELVFGRRIFRYDFDGELLHRASRFTVCTPTWDIPLDGDEVEPELASWPTSQEEEAWTALTIGIRDYVTRQTVPRRSSSAFLAVGFGLGGHLVCRCPGPGGRIMGCVDAEQFSSGGSVDDARELADNLGVKFTVTPIIKAVEAMTETMGELLDGPGHDLPGDLQARIRGDVLMNYSTPSRLDGSPTTATDRRPPLVLLHPWWRLLRWVRAAVRMWPRTFAYALAEWRNTVEINGIAKPIPVSDADQGTQRRACSGSGRHQLTAALPVLDAIIVGYLEEMASPKEFADAGHRPRPEPRRRCRSPGDLGKVMRMIDRRRAQRRQVAPA